MDVQCSSDDSLRWLRVCVRAERVQRFIRREGVRLNLRNVLVAVNVRSLEMTKSLCLLACMHARVCVRWVSVICEPSPGKRRGSTDVSLSEPNMKHRKRPLWSLPTCQSALHRDRLLRLLMCRTDRPETHMQTQTHWGKKKQRCYEYD